jgi:tetratricopeptide (TPR) repeat protein
MNGALRAEPQTVEEFVGRDAELGGLLAGLELAREGRGSLFLIGGEPGIGKSRLADEFAGRAREHGVRVLWGRCWEGAGAPAYWPWIQALRSHLRTVDPELARVQLGPGAADIAQMLPEIRTLVTDLPPAPAESDSARFQLFDSTASFLRNVASAQETVLVLEDLHAADTPSVLLLRFLAGQLSDMRLLVIATYRDIELTPDHPLTPALREMARETTTRLIQLSGLAQADTARVVEATTGRGRHAQLVARLWRETSGNPLFLLEAVALLAAEGRLDDVSAGERLRLNLPAGVRDVITRRVRHLGERTVQALTIGAALGPEFSAEVVRRVGAYAGDDLLDVLGEAAQAGLIGPVGLGRFRFSHDLVREALYDELTPAERIRLHRRIADALEELYGASLDTRLGELAHHYFEASLGGLGDDDASEARRVADKAKTYARRAAEQAVRSLAYEEGARLYQIALHVLDLEGSTDAAQRAEILVSVGDAQARAGNLPAAQSTFLEAATFARRSGAAQHLAHAALGYGGRFFWGRAGNDPHLTPLLQDALVLLGGADDRLRVRLLTRLACAWRGHRDQLDQSAALSQQAVEIARRLDDPATLSYALAGRVGAIYWPETTIERLQIAQELLITSQATGDPERIIDAHMIRSFIYADLARMSEARAEIETLTVLAEDLRQPVQLWLANAAKAAYALLSGAFAEAEKLMEVESAPDYPTTPIKDDVSSASMHRFLLGRERDGLATEEPTVRRAVSEFPWYPAHRAALVLLLLELDRPAEARPIFAELARDGFAAFVKDNEWLFCVALASEACAWFNDSPAAASLYERLLPFAGLHAIGHTEGSAGIVDRYLGLLALVLDRVDEAEEHLRQATVLNDAMGAVPWRAHSQSDLARLLRRRAVAGDAAQAEQLEREALETARKLGMTALTRRLEERPASRAPAMAVASEGPSAGTFRREGEYWTVSFGADSFRLRDSKGLQYLGRLLAEPGREVLALDLLDRPARTDSAGLANGSDLRVTQIGDAGVALDAEAKQAYRQRLRDLQEELDEAESWNDPERADRAREEIDFLGRELARAVGLGGRDRAAGSASERARLSVTRAIRLAMARIAEHSPALGQHLETTIHTGTYCAYRPDTRVPVEWHQ